VSKNVLCVQKYPEHAVYKVIQFMIRREEIQHRMQRKILYRVKWTEHTLWCY